MTTITANRTNMFGTLFLFKRGVIGGLLGGFQRAGSCTHAEQIGKHTDCSFFGLLDGGRVRAEMGMIVFYKPHLPDTATTGA